MLVQLTKVKIVHAELVSPINLPLIVHNGLHKSLEILNISQEQCASTYPTSLMPRSWDHECMRENGKWKENVCGRVSI